MPRLFIADSGSAARQAKRIFIADSGGVTRQVKKIYIGDSGGVARLVYGAGYVGTITCGADINGDQGYLGGGFGDSINPTKDFFGVTVSSFFISGTDGSLNLALAANVPSNYFKTLTVDIHSVLASAATFFPWNGAASTWSWASGTYAITLPTGNTLPWSYSL